MRRKKNSNFERGTKSQKTYHYTGANRRVEGGRAGSGAMGSVMKRKNYLRCRYSRRYPGNGESQKWEKNALIGSPRHSGLKGSLKRAIKGKRRYKGR